MREALISRHASTLKYLELHGDWKLDLNNHSLIAAETISLTEPSTQSFNQLLTNCGDLLSTVIIKKVEDVYEYDATDRLAPNLQNIFIGMFRIALF